ncbi:hypothetical protein A0H81_10698 [Grifola frondosa]|uniref:Uncharacterized protein n=1 Tax=Grifola frondosa TaxID=5627 RepID=A0A1C7LX37_GRIFR|nr:hypothetical protein A0H81_10698 [Grifola frondosa]
MASKTLKDVLREQAMLQARTRARDGRGRVARGADDPAAALPVIHIRDAKRLDFALLEQNRAIAEVAAADASPEQAFLETPPSQAHMRGHHLCGPAACRTHIAQLDGAPHDALAVADVAYSSTTRRKLFRHFVAVTGCSAEELLRNLHDMQIAEVPQRGGERAKVLDPESRTRWSFYMATHVPA